MRKSVILVAVVALSVPVSHSASAEVFCGFARAVAAAPAFLATFTPAVEKDFFTPKPAQPLCGPYCDMSEGGTTPTEQGSGSSCANAQSSLITQLTDIANSFCRGNTGFNSCNRILTTTVACHLTSPGVYQESGYYTYGCKDTTC